MSKNNRNRDHRRNGSQRPPTAGAVDLEALRKRPDHEEKIAAATIEVLSRQGLLCPCGERVREEGVEYMAVITSDAATPAGPVANVALGATTFHSLDCAMLAQLLAEDQAPGTQPLALRAAQPVIWLDERETAAP